MVFALPANLRDLVLYIWKIIDSHAINIDVLTNIMAFELNIATPDKCREITTQMIQQGFLLENEDLEEISLAPDLQQLINTWQASGTQIAQIMHQKLSMMWREPYQISESVLYQVFLQDLIDFSIIQKAEKILSSAIKIDKIDSTQNIMGTVEIDITSNPDHTKFSIDLHNRILQHNCNDFQLVRKDQKRLCIHLARVIMKLYVTQKEFTFQLIKDMVTNRELWKYEMC
jgi:hypothetical protein